jgi:hypothetical protein
LPKITPFPSGTIFSDCSAKNFSIMQNTNGATWFLSRSPRGEAWWAV